MYMYMCTGVPEMVLSEVSAALAVLAANGELYYSLIGEHFHLRTQFICLDKPTISFKCMYMYVYTSALCFVCV